MKLKNYSQFFYKMMPLFIVRDENNNVNSAFAAYEGTVLKRQNLKRK